MEIRFLELNSVCCPERSFNVAGKSWDDGVVKMNTIFKEEIRVSKIAVFCYKEILATFNILVNQFVWFLNSRPSTASIRGVTSLIIIFIPGNEALNLSTSV